MVCIYIYANMTGGFVDGGHVTINMAYGSGSVMGYDPETCCSFLIPPSDPASRSTPASSTLSY